MKPRNYNFARAVVFLTVIALALGPVDAGAQFVMHCAGMPASTSLTCPHMSMATSTSTPPPCCARHIQPPSTRPTAFANPCQVTVNDTIEVLGSSVVPGKIQIYLGAPSVLAPPATFVEEPVVVVDPAHFTVHSLGPPPADIARTHGLRAPPSC